MKEKLKTTSILFNDYLKLTMNEAPIAMVGDWENHTFKNDIGFKKQFTVDANWTLKDTILINNKEINIYKSKENGKTYILGVPGTLENKKGIIEVSRGKLRSMKSVQNHTKHKNAMQMEQIYTHKDYRGEGITSKFYAWLISVEGYQIVSDAEQYDGARKIYSNLSKNFNVDIYDNINNKTMKTNYDLVHGEEYWEFDEDVYSVEGDIPTKEDVLIIMYK